MSIKTQYQAGITSTAMGRTCDRCGAWIGVGVYHTCTMGTGQASTPQYYQWPMQVISIDDETKRLLERIAVALEKLVGVLV